MTAGNPGDFGARIMVRGPGVRKTDSGKFTVWLTYLIWSVIQRWRYNGALCNHEQPGIR
jgi:hypothetical protein